MTKQNETAQADLIQAKSLTPLEAAHIIDGAVDAILANIEKTETALDKASSEDGNQLRTLADALKYYPEPITEEVWDTVFSARVMERLARAKKGHYERYTSKNSREVSTAEQNQATVAE